MMYKEIAPDKGNREASQSISDHPGSRTKGLKINTAGCVQRPFIPLQICTEETDYISKRCHHSLGTSQTSSGFNP